MRINLRLILSIISLIISGVIAVIDFFWHIRILTVMSIVFLAVSVSLFILCFVNFNSKK